MQRIQLEQQEPQPIDDATKLALEQAREEARRGETVTLEQSNINLRKRLQAWRKAKEEAALTV